MIGRGPGIFAFALVLANGAAGQAPPASTGIRIDFDFQAARTTLDALAGRPSMDAAAAAKLPGNVRMVEHQHQFDAAATESRLVESLRQAGTGQPIEPDTFMLGRRARPRLEATRAMLGRIEADPRALADEIRRPNRPLHAAGPEARRPFFRKAHPVQLGVSGRPPARS